MDLSTFRQLKPDLVVLDIGLHRQNGIDLLEGFITMYLASQLGEGPEYSGEGHRQETMKCGFAKRPSTAGE